MRPLRILVVDDSVVIRKLLSDTLAKEEGFEVAGTAGDGRIALAKIAQLHPDLITLDIEMPVIIVHLSDLLCRMRGIGYGYYERRMVDMISDPAWTILAREHRELESMDLARFTFELDDAVGEICELVSNVFGASPVPA